MQLVVPIFLLVCILALLCSSVQKALRAALQRRPAVLFAVPVILSGIFLAAAAQLHAFNAALAVLILAYTFAPVTCAFLVRRSAPPVWLDFVIIALLWFPLEFSVGQSFIAKRAQGPLHLAAYGVSILLGLTIFLLFRRLPDMKYNLPRTGRDLTNLLIGFAACTVVLIPLGRAIGFLTPFHMPAANAPRIALQYVVILASTALPEEILFRGLIQNSLMQRLGANTGSLLLAAFIFGCAHLDNGPQPLPNWRYMILATIAGIAYGKVFEKSSSILASAALHALVDTIKHVSF
ncbi:MAG TPA: type II CAAX endopeptidase family protein [Bryobacteraceae bacterium]|nr:type II CAAX endopeptidase family protein [Bryobacteraceae bacterium]